MSGEDRITYEEFMIMFKNAPRVAYTLYDKAEDEIEKKDKVLDKIKDIIKDRAYWCDETEDGDIVSGKLLQDDDITEIEELLEEIE